MITYTQPSLFDAVSTPEQPTKKPTKCHFKGCVEPVVGSSTAKRNAYVCKHHNEVEWATALSRGKDGYWRQFGQSWLRKLSERRTVNA